VSDPSGNLSASYPSSSASDWWTSGDPRQNPSARTNIAAALPAVAPSEQAPSAISSPPRTSLRPTTAPLAAQFALLVSGALVVVGSVTSWVSVSVFGHSISVAGTASSISTAISINGWITVALGIVLVILGGLVMASSSPPTLRTLAAVTSAIAFGFSTYFVVRILQELSKAHAAIARNAAFGRSLGVSEHIGWGLVLLLIAAVAAAISSAVALRSN
jgi:hypothetical protein